MADGAGVQDSVEAVREIRVTLLEFSITPSAIRVQAGEKVRFTITNAGSIFHTFTFETWEVSRSAWTSRLGRRAQQRY